MIVGLVPADGGQISLNGQDLTQEPIHVRARQGLSYLPQEASVFRRLSVADNIRAVLELQLDTSGQKLSANESREDSKDVGRAADRPHSRQPGPVALRR